MARPDDVNVSSPELVPLWCAWLAILAMAAFYWRFHGFGVPDWEGYGELWDGDGGWLLRQGRDPLFVWLIHLARYVFGADGYDEFRELLFGVFTVFAARAAYAIRAANVSLLIALPIVIAVLLLKSLAQVREGIALLLVTWPLIGVFTRQRHAWVSTGCLAILASFVHPAAWLFVALWLAALTLYVGPNWLVAGTAPPLCMLIASTICGVAIELAIVGHGDALEFALRNLGADMSAVAVGGFEKYAYWLAMGILVFVARKQLILTARGSTKFGYGYLILLSCLVLPCLYTACATLVFDRFYLPIVTAAVVRMLLTSLEVALLVIGFRGRANWLTMLMAVALIADETRLLAFP